MNTTGRIFRVSVFGESHGEYVGAMLDGLPPGISIDHNMIREDLLRRSPAAKWETPRHESDSYKIISGVFEGFSTGAPLVILIKNRDAESSDYDMVKRFPRPGHADETARIKYGGFQDHRGGGMFSGRLTAPLVAAGSLARGVIPGVSISCEVEKTGPFERGRSLTEAMERGDSVGGVIACTVNDLPAGIGEPFFNSIESSVSSLMFSIPGVTGVSFGAGFNAPEYFGSEYIGGFDEHCVPVGSKCGGVNGGISNGTDITFKVAVRPPSTIGMEVDSFDRVSGKTAKLRFSGRHDVTFADRMPVIVEACARLALTDLFIFSGHYGTGRR